MKTGQKLWRSLDELAGTAEFEEMLHREFPVAVSEWTDDVSRRRFLKLMGASLALAGLAGCSQKPEEKIVPYVNQPEQAIPGKPLYFATATTFRGYARGILVESHDGRPTKIEGNPDHPASLGATDVFGQAALLDLYDPDRSQTVMRAGEVSAWSNFIAAMETALAAHRGNGASGAGLRILTQTITSPTLAAQIRDVLKAYPGARWHQYDPVNRNNAAAGAKMAFGADVQAVYRFDQAKVIVSLDDNFLFDHPGSVRYARDFINGRRVRHDRRAMNRLYVAESTPSITGAMADHRLSVKPSEIVALSQQLSSGGNNEWATAAAKDLAANRGAGLVVAGESQPPMEHALVASMNLSLGNVGKTVVYVDPIEAEPTNHLESLRALVADMTAGAARTLMIVGGNPAYDAPADLNFAQALKAFSDQQQNFSAHLASHYDETSFRAQWHLPLAHELESWGDARAYDGTAGIIQPLIAPLYQGRSAIEVMAHLVGQRSRSGYEIVRDYWRTQQNSSEFETWWEKCLHDGLIAGTAAPAIAVKAGATVAPTSPATTQPKGDVEVVFRPDPSLWDGRYANNAWLMELPKPLTRLTWDNVALMSAKTARELRVTHNGVASPGNKVEVSVVEISVGQQEVKAPVWIMPGQPDGVITVHLGHGRTHAGRVGNGVGFNAHLLRNSNAPWFAPASAKVIDETTELACVQNHSMMEQHERDLLKVAEVSRYESVAKTKAAHGAHHKGVSLSLYPEYDYAKTPNKWGMVIDQNACFGCNACVIACQAENNIPVVGKEEVAKGREMHWLRVDNYFAGDAHNPAGPYFQPVPCMHCENAPCEVVCPVAATVHDAEGTNNMVYNRCVGTRYCSNNCPYKVRHFNFLHYTKNIDGPLKLMMNPDVTVRYRGVMEKCSYCIQRINAGRIDAKVDDRAINDGEVVTACQQVCPTMAITFGNLNDPKAGVTKLVAEPTNYGLLDELQTKPRTTYLPRFTNPAS